MNEPSFTLSKQNNLVSTYLIMFSAHPDIIGRAVLAVVFATASAVRGWSATRGRAGRTTAARSAATSRRASTALRPRRRPGGRGSITDSPSRKFL